MDGYVITMDKIADIRRFVDIAHSEKGSFTLSRKNRRVNARSLLGVFSLDVTRPCVLSAGSRGELESLVARLREAGFDICPETKAAG